MEPTEESGAGSESVRPAVFALRIRVIAKEIDRQGHVNNVVYLRYAQDAAVAHWNAVASQEHRDAILWVVRRHEIDYLKPAFLNDELEARTWVGELTGATFERFVEIVRADPPQVLARVRTVWVALDPRTQRPRRIPADLLAAFHQPRQS